MGGFLYPAIVGSLAAMLSNLNAAETQFLQKRKQLNDFLEFAQFPTILRGKMNRFYDYLWSRQKGVDEDTILQDLPPALRIAVQESINGNIIRSVPFFADLNNEFLQNLLGVLKPSVFLPGDVIIRAAEVSCVTL